LIEYKEHKNLTIRTWVTRNELVTYGYVIKIVEWFCFYKDKNCYIIKYNDYTFEEIKKLIEFNKTGKLIMFYGVNDNDRNKFCKFRNILYLLDEWIIFQDHGWPKIKLNSQKTELILDIFSRQSKNKNDEEKLIVNSVKDIKQQLYNNIPLGYFSIRSEKINYILEDNV
jgi:hypothetical protein